LAIRRYMQYSESFKQVDETKLATGIDAKKNIMI
jgi:hypothetical protein